VSHVAYNEDDKLIQDISLSIPKLYAAMYFKILFFSFSLYVFFLQTTIKLLECQLLLSCLDQTA
jgi:hypothetical protein